MSFIRNPCRLLKIILLHALIECAVPRMLCGTPQNRAGKKKPAPGCRNGSVCSLAPANEDYHQCSRNYRFPVKTKSTFNLPPGDILLFTAGMEQYARGLSFPGRANTSMYVMYKSSFKQCPYIFYRNKKDISESNLTFEGAGYVQMDQLRSDAPGWRSFGGRVVWRENPAGTMPAVSNRMYEITIYSSFFR